MEKTSFSYNDIIADDNCIIATRTVKANASSARVAGTVLGKLTATGKLEVYDDDVDPADGSETAMAILMEEVPASSTDTEVPVLLTGMVRRASLTGLDASGEADLALRGIHMDTES
jgi:hypothetical protein